MREPDVSSAAATPHFTIRTESARERDVFRYLYPWAAEYEGVHLHRNAFPPAAVDTNPPTTTSATEPRACPDTALVAFAQLCALRLRVRRCFVTLISRDDEYVLAEATRTMSLQYGTVEDPKDQLWLGTSSFAREDGLNGEVLDSWRRARHVREPKQDPGYWYTEGSSQHWNIISDVRGNGRYAEREFVKRHPGMRFYASIPLRGTRGTVVGSVTLIDDQPRYGLSALQLDFLEDVADTIAQHLDATVIRSQRQRSERLIQSLALFNSGKSSLRHWWLKQQDAKQATSGRHHIKELTAGERDAAANEEFGLRGEKHWTTSPDETESAAESEPANMSSSSLQGSGVSTNDFVEGSSRRRNKNSRSRPQSPRSAKVNPKPAVDRLGGRPKAGRSPNETFDLPTASRKVYARASNLMREALSADGVVFLGVSPAQTKHRGSGQSISSTSDRSQKHTSDTDTSDGAPPSAELSIPQAISTVQSSSMRQNESRNLSQGLALPEDFVSTLIQKHPHGHIYNFAQDGSCYSTSGEDSVTSESNSDGRAKKRRTPRDAKRLADAIPGVRTIAFYPIRDENRGQWTSCVFVWSSSPLRHFDEIEDVTYLVSWSHSVVAELSRLETIAADRAKGSFISSVSHELRSPLHGVLAAVEFLQESELTPFQQEMAYTISIAGRTLLDTMNHVLDYSKISSFTRAQRKQRSAVDARRFSIDANDSSESNEIGVTSNVDLARLTEEIVESVVSTHRFQASFKNIADEVSITVNIPWRRNWMVRMQPGGWARIVTNLVGNALKYTEKGTVSVRIDVGEATSKSNSGSNCEKYPIRLIVEDTGIGISKPFLASGLYTPFMQENSHSVGTGLGLSIVRQICSDMGAQLNVTSELGKGTRATVDVEMPFSSDSSPNLQASRDLDIRRFHLIATKASKMASSAIASSIAETAKDWLGCETSSGTALEQISGSVVYAIAEKNLASVGKGEIDQLRAKMEGMSNAPSRVLVLGESLQSVSLAVSLQNMAVESVFVHQPIGPQKLLRAITFDQSSARLESPSDNPSIALSPASAKMDYSLQTPLASPGAGSFPWQVQVRSPGDNNSGKDARPARMVRSSGSSSSFPSPRMGPKHRMGSSIASVSEAATSPDGTAGSGKESGEDSKAQQRGDTVLLVEDNEVNMKLLAALMRKLSLPYTTATNGSEALTAYTASPSAFCLILMDISMPVMDGIEATSQIRDFEKKLGGKGRCMIVALTGVTSDEARERAFAAGVDDFFAKPVRMGEVRGLVGRAKGNGG